jgi:hypothetical protein
VSTTTASIVSACRAATASSRVLKTFGGVLRLDVLGDVSQAGRADLVAVDVLAEVSGRVLLHDRVGLQRDDGLLDRVVALREGHDLRPVRRSGNLVDVEVELLRTRGVARVEGLGGPDDVRGLESQRLGEGVDGTALAALAVGGGVVREPGLVNRVVGGDGQLALREELRLNCLLAGRDGGDIGGTGGVGKRREGQRGGPDQSSCDELKRTHDVVLSRRHLAE